MDRPLLRVLSLDGEGIRGLSSLLILENIMERLRQEHGLDQVPKPCEWFDLIGGTSTGGIIAIMLGKLGMTVDECIRAYKKVAQQAFTPKPWAMIPGTPSGVFSAKQLEAAIEQTIRDHCIDPMCTERRKREKATAATCPHGEMQFRGDSYTKTVVLAITKDNVDSLPTLFKTYDTSASLEGCTVWQVARATSAATTFFKPIEVGRDQIKFIDAGFGYSNPCEVLIREAKNQFPDRDEMRVLSIGTGLGDVVSIKDTRTSILKALKKMATTAKKVALRLDEQYSASGNYYRFNVERGLEDISLSDWDRSSTISSHTHNYLNETKREIGKFVQSLTQTAMVAPANETQESPVPQVIGNTVVHSIPFDKNSSFTGRRTIIKKITGKLSKTTDCNRVALLGLGGAGKTQIALHMAHWVKDNVKDCSVFWIPAFSMAGFEQECVQLVKRLRIPCSPDQDAKEVVQRYLNSGAIGKWFMVVDNIDDMEVLRGSTTSKKGISRFLPKHPDGRILLTTRSRDIALQLTNELVHLSHMEPKEASDLFKSLLVQETCNNDILTELLEVLTYLPLAIAQAAAYINKYEVTLSQYIDLCNNTDERNIMELFEYSFDDETYNDNSQSAVATTWFISFDRIRSSNQSAADLLSFMAYIEPRAIPQSILPTFDTDQQQLCAIGTLKGHGVLSQRGRDPLYDMHRLVHLATRKWIHQAGDPTRIQQMTLQRIYNVFPSNEWQHRELWRQYLPHALRLIRISNQIESELLFYLCIRIVACLIRDFRGDEALAIMEHISPLNKTTLPCGHTLQQRSIQWLAMAYRQTGQPKMAVNILEDLVETQAQTLSEDDHFLLLSQNVLGAVYIDAGKINKAISILESVVRVRDRTPAIDEIDRLSSQHELARAYLQADRLKEAIDTMEPIVKAHGPMFGNDDPNRLLTLHLLAQVYMKTNQSTKAVDILQSVVDIQKRIFTEDDPNILASSYDLGRAYLDTGQRMKAVEVLEPVVKIDERTLAEDDPNRLNSRQTLAFAYCLCGQTEQAIRITKDVIAIRTKKSIENDPWLQNAKDILQKCYDRYEESSYTLQ